VGDGKRPVSVHPHRPLFPFGVCSTLEDEIMDKDRVVGSAKQVKGAVKQSVGRAVGDAKLKSEGQADKVEGKIQNAIGSRRDRLKAK
jgi:uncharacterized protein YjbJ (UPF0337 family)